ncbi:asparagine synthase (glutamine-hydrolysing) [Algoriphagus aquaeductus]|uniref:asparagine synthase (glutamine-hydrolyzing) n=1 Tax=Algoriphagus aquaeductus TaxID=475299 RepID=A0A326RN30_9BACT|nr:asparagine synthase (glutamine-hydrolyzing) [Algoriphagus aquaeductus]PZV79126.1 asparagine synthase (glutamine-hydrolysing) [Algoriphagus aquaeductus]
MCGIVGIIGLNVELNQKDYDLLDDAIYSQNHRGPDASSRWYNSNIALGHNRLSIIDLSTSSNQPFYREDLGLTIVFNGEIYNYKLLKNQLQEKGYQFYTTSDTEVILVAYREYGSNVTQYLEGMFALVIYNHFSNEVFMARDRFGEKPIFYIESDNKILFASELLALKKLFNERLTLNQNAVVDLMENMYINLHHSIYEEVKVFPPASQLVIKNGNSFWSKYYQIPTKVDYSPGFTILKSEVRDLLTEIISRELFADVPVATFLSSGIDSSVISGIAKELKSDLLAITMSTGDESSDETEDAKKFAKKLKIQQEIVSVNPGALNILAKLLKNIQPLADASLIPTHLVTETVASHTKVMLSGDGGDEVFGSYNKPSLYLKYGQKRIPAGGLALFGLMEFTHSSLEKYLSDKNRIKLNGWDGFYSKTNLSGCFDKVFKSGRGLNRVLELCREIRSDYSKNPEKLSFGVDMASRLPADFLFKVDSASMKSSLEVRAPFLDHRLVDLSFRSDINSLMPNRMDKEITRSIYKDLVGYDHQGNKKGFSIPYSKYLVGDWGNTLEKFLGEKLSEQFLNFNSQGILEMLGEHRKSPRQSLARILFSALVLEIWLRVFHLEQELSFSFPKN